MPALLHKAAELEMITQTQGAEEKSLPASLSSADRVRQSCFAPDSLMGEVLAYPPSSRLVHWLQVELLSDIMGELKTDEAFAKIFADKKAPVGVGERCCTALLRGRLATCSMCACVPAELLAWMERNEVVKVSTALHDEGERERVWKALRGWGQEALNEVAAYYGEGVAFYFAWVQFYQLWLLVPAIAGVLLAFVFSSPGVTGTRDCLLALSGRSLYSACLQSTTIRSSRSSRCWSRCGRPASSR